MSYVFVQFAFSVISGNFFYRKRFEFNAYRPFTLYVISACIFMRAKTMLYAWYISHIIPKQLFAQMSISLTFGIVFGYVQFAANISRITQLTSISRWSPSEVPLTCKCLNWIVSHWIADSGGIWFLS